MPFYLRDLISEAIPDVNFSIQTSILNDLRKIKTEKEVKLMKQAAKINDQVLRQLRDEIQIGMTEQQVVAYADFFGRKLGADLGSATVVMSGYNTKFPAWRATNKEINKGEFVMVDFNPTIENYCNDGGVTFLMSGASKKKIEALEMSHQFLKEVIKNIKANNKASSIHDQFYNLYQVQNIFKAGEELNISLFNNQIPSLQKTLDGNQFIYSSGYKYYPVLWRVAETDQIYYIPSGSNPLSGVLTVNSYAPSNTAVNYSTRFLSTTTIITGRINIGIIIIGRIIIGRIKIGITKTCS
jgi:hypothetical protein